MKQLLQKLKNLLRNQQNRERKVLEILRDGDFIGLQQALSKAIISADEAVNNLATVGKVIADIKYREM